MQRTKLGSALASASEGFSVELFNGRGLPELIGEALSATNKWGKRKRALSAPVLVWLVLFMSLHRSVSIKNVFRMLIELLREVDPDLSLNEVCEEALYHGRTRLGVAPVQALFHALAEDIEPAASFHELKPWGIDGLRLTTPDTRANEAAFGRPTASRGQTAFPQMLTVALVDTDHHRVKDFVEYPTTGSERDGYRHLIKHLGSGDIVLLDRGFPDGELFETTMEVTHFCARLPSTWKPRKIRCLGPGDWIVEVAVRKPIPPEERKGRRKFNTTYLILRMIEYRVGKVEVVRVITDLLDPEEYPAMDFAVLYHQRWEVELVFDEIETHLQCVTHGTMDTVFRSKSPDGVRQELYAMFTTYNLTRDAIAEAATQHNIPPLEISFVDSVEVIRRSVRSFQGSTLEEYACLEKRLSRDIADCRLDRLRRPRWYPRVIKVKISKWPVKGPQHVQEFHDFVEMIELVELAPIEAKAA